jgi:hypothetical protein
MPSTLPIKIASQALSACDAKVILIIIGAPVLGATTVLTWHGLRGSTPGPAASQLLKLVELVTFRRRKD